MRKTLLGLALLGALAACERQPVYQQAAPAAVAPGAAPVVVNQDSGASSMLMGGALGYLLGRHSAPAAPALGSYNAPAVVHQTTVVHKTVNVTQAAPAAPTPSAAIPMPAAKPAPVAAPAPTKSVSSSYGSVYRAAKPVSAPVSRSYGSAYSSSRSGRR